jgi:Zinc knuckle
MGKDQACFQCGQTGHHMADCNARRDVDGKTITSRMEEGACERLRKFWPQESQESSNLGRSTPSLNDVVY